MGRSEMAELIRSFEWARSPLGPPEQWPKSLKTTLQVVLASRFQLAIYWGPQLVLLYNDAEREVLGALHPGALGRPAREVLVDIWDRVGPMLSTVFESGEATLSLDQPLMIDRHGLLEEAFFTWSYSPIPDDSGGIGGVLLITEETTSRVLAERRLRTLMEISARSVLAQNTVPACATAIGTLTQCSADVPFAILYLADATGKVKLCSYSGVKPYQPRRELTIKEIDGAREVLEVNDLRRLFEGEAEQKLADRALMLPIQEPGSEDIAGILVAGVSQHYRLDTAYRNFFDAVAVQIGTTIASTRARERERSHLKSIAELDRAKTAFFTNISHEYRTPLTLILGIVDDMLTKTDIECSDSVRQQLSIIRKNGERLLKLVNTVLAFSRVDAGSMQAVYRPTNIAAFTTELASGFRSLFEQAGVQFRVELQSLPEPVYVDRDMWEKIILNLLSNAFKFTFQGEVSVTSRTWNDHAQVIIRDTGIGIAPDELSHIFERFRRVETAQGRTQEGAGIGLALVQELLKLHGGYIEAESVPGEGSTFTVSIPFGTKHLPSDCIREDETAAPDALTARSYIEEARRWLPTPDKDEHSSRIRQSLSLADRDRPLILLADDNADMRDYLRSLLDEHYRIQTAQNGDQALIAIRRTRPALILADVMMPKMDGFSLLQQVRADPHTSTLPVIMLSARADECERIWALEHGADDYLVKPFSSRELLARIQSHVEIARIRMETAERERKLRGEADAQRALLETVVNGMPAGLIIAQAPSGNVVLANQLAEQILQRSVRELRHIEEYSQYRLFRTDGSPYDTKDMPLARSVARGETVMGEELRYVRPDGTVRVLLVNSAPVRADSESIVAGVAAFQDITELRRAQEELLRQNNDVIHDLAGKLITTQEEERRRIARDLHDDCAQRLSLLCVKADELRSQFPARSRAGKQAAEICRRTKQAADSVRQVSHQLHHSALMLGLSEAARGFCREFSGQRGIQIDFKQKGQIHSLPEQVSLALFRILQESLNNVVRHSGAAQAQVSLLTDRDQVTLRVKDRGKGFDPMQISDGLGLLSMRERLRLIGGKIQLSSAPGLGTEIAAVVPLMCDHRTHPGNEGESVPERALADPNERRAQVARSPDP